MINASIRLFLFRDFHPYGVYAKLYVDILRRDANEAALLFFAILIIALIYFYYYYFH